MPILTRRQPAYRRHKARNCAVVTIDGKNHYLGSYDSPESHEGYARKIAEWRARDGETVNSVEPSTAPNLSVNDMLLAYWRFAKTYYIKDGKPVNAVVISRPSKWGNPFHIDGTHDRPTVVQMFREWIGSDDPRAVKMRSEIGELRGKDLLCFCPEGGPCHGDVLLELANRQ